MAAPCAVLIVEDDNLVRALLADTLRDEGFIVRTAAHRQEALAVLAQWRPNLIILDLDMPVMDGRTFRAAQRGVSEWAGIPVLVMSAGANLKAQAEQLEAVEALPKPCDLEVLIAAIRRVASIDPT